MSRINSVSPDKANQEVKEIYHNLEKKLGRVPNIFLNMGNSSSVLKGYLGIQEATGQMSLSPQIREKIALTVGQANDCQYCLAAHIAIAKGTGIDEQAIMQARHAHDNDTKTTAILKFAKTIVDNKGKINNQDISSLKAAGVNDTEIVEIIFVVVANIFTNYFNHITDPQIDFPTAPELS